MAIVSHLFTYLVCLLHLSVGFLVHNRSSIAVSRRTPRSLCPHSRLTPSPQGESYSLACGFVVDREQLIKDGNAQILVRTALYLNEQPVSLQILEDVTLTVTTQDKERVSNTKVRALIWRVFGGLYMFLSPCCVVLCCVCVVLASCLNLTLYTDHQGLQVVRRPRVGLHIPRSG